MDGLENVIDPWVEGIWGPLEAAMAGKATTAAAAPAAGPAPVAAAAAAPAVASAAAPAATPAATAAVASSAAASALAPAPAAAAPAATAAAEATSSSPAAHGQGGQLRRVLSSVAVRPEQEYGLVGGRAPPEADLKGAPAAAPCRTRVVWEEDADAAAAVSGAGGSCEWGGVGWGRGDGIRTLMVWEEHADAAAAVSGTVGVGGRG